MKKNNILYIFWLLFSITFFLLISILLNKYGLIIGWLIGLFSSMISFMYVFLLKIKDLKKFHQFTLMLNFLRFFLNIIIIIFLCFMQFFFKNRYFFWSVFTFSISQILNGVINFFQIQYTKNEN